MDALKKKTHLSSRKNSEEERLRRKTSSCRAELRSLMEEDCETFGKGVRSSRWADYRKENIFFKMSEGLLISHQ